MRKTAISLISVLMFSCCDAPQRPWDKDIYYLDYKDQYCSNLKDRSGRSDIKLSDCDGFLCESIQTYQTIDNALTACQEALKQCQGSH